MEIEWYRHHHFDLHAKEKSVKERELYGRSLNIFKITYYWQCLKVVGHNYTVLVSFIDANGRTAFSQDHSACYGEFQTSNWMEGDVVKEGYYIYVPKDVPQGIYRIQMGLWCPSTGEYLKTESNVSISTIIGNIKLEDPSN